MRTRPATVRKCDGGLPGRQTARMGKQQSFWKHLGHLAWLAFCVARPPGPLSGRWLSGQPRASGRERLGFLAFHSCMLAGGEGTRSFPFYTLVKTFRAGRPPGHWRDGWRSRRACIRFVQDWWGAEASGRNGFPQRPKRHCFSTAKEKKEGVGAALGEQATGSSLRLWHRGGLRQPEGCRSMRLIEGPGGRVR